LRSTLRWGIAMLRQLIVFAMSLFYLSTLMGAELDSRDNITKTSVFGVDVKNATSDFPRVIFQDGMTFGDKQSWQAVESLANLVEMPVGRFNIKFDPTPGMTMSDAVAEKALRDINKRWEMANTKGVIVLFMAGNNQLIKALEVGKLYDHKIDNISFVAVANLITTEQRIAWLKESQETGDHPFVKYADSIELRRILMGWKSNNK
jgi:hypothetical protein